ncbi:MAG TPA: hypothetical protein VLJ59_06855 [Mycobacteriales bacterium]|nr:hypothetical protein [Mycobacteriales bacterium]
MSMGDETLSGVSCLVCGRLVGRPTTGRPPRYCSAACRQAGYVRRRRAGVDPSALRAEVLGRAEELARGLDDLAVLMSADLAGANGPATRVVAVAVAATRRRVSLLDGALRRLGEVMEARAVVHAVPALNTPSVTSAVVTEGSVSRPAPAPGLAPVEDAGAPQPPAAGPPRPAAPAGPSTPEPEPQVRVVADLAAELGPGWTLTELAGEERGRYQVRLDGEIVGAVVDRHSA